MSHDAIHNVHEMTHTQSPYASPRNICDYDASFSLPSHNTAWLLSLENTNTTENAAGVWEVILNLSANAMHSSTSP